MTSQKPIDRTRIFTRSEIAEVLGELTRKGKRSANTRQNSALFRLATCCGLRVKECVGIKLKDVVTSGKRPYIDIKAEVAKRKKPRRVALWWDAATLAALDAWKAERLASGAKPGDPFLCSLAVGTHSRTGKPSKGKPLTTRNAQARFKAAIKCLGAERVQSLSIHSGRHSFCSHALAGGRSLAEVRDAAGHSNIATTSIYLHSVGNDDEGVGSLFDFGSR